MSSHGIYGCEGKNPSGMNVEEREIYRGVEGTEKWSYRLIKTSPGPGSGISSSSIFVEMEPGLSYTAALYFFGRSTEPIFAADPNLLSFQNVQSRKLSVYDWENKKTICRRNHPRVQTQLLQPTYTPPARLALPSIAPTSCMHQPTNCTNRPLPNTDQPIDRLQIPGQIGPSPIVGCIAPRRRYNSTRLRTEALEATPHCGV